MRLVAVVFVLASLSLIAQEDVLRPNGRPPGSVAPASTGSSSVPVILGLEVGANFNFFGQKMTGTWEESPYNAFSSGFGVSALVGLYVDFPISSTIGIGMRALYDMKRFGNEEGGKLLDCTLQGGGFTPAPITVDYTETINYITFNPLVRIQATNALFFHVGPVIQLAVGQVTNRTRYTVDEASECRFFIGTPDESTMIEGQVTADPSVTTRVGLDAGVGYRIPLSSLIDLVPRVGFQWMITEYAPDQDFIDDSRINTIGPANASATSVSLSSLQASLSLWFNL
jgi:hypothetical protein